MALSWKGHEFQRQREQEVGRKGWGVRSWLRVFAPWLHYVTGTELLTILEPFYFQVGLTKLPPHHMAAPRTSAPITPSTLPGL